MPNLTPLKYRRLYEIYPAKACINETGDQCNGCLRRAHCGHRPPHRPGAGRPLDPQPHAARRAAAKRNCAMPETPVTNITICMGSSCFSRGNNRNIEVIQDYLASAEPAARRSN